MSSTGYSIQVTNLSPNATEKDVHDFFAFCGAIQHVEIVRGGEYACTAYVTFRNSHAVETAVLLSGATILDQTVCIVPWGQFGDEHDIWKYSSWKIEDESESTHHSQGRRIVPSAGEAVSFAQGAVKTVAAKGYVIGKGALNQVKAFDESHQVSAKAVAKVSNFSDRIGLTDKIFSGVEAARYVDQRYHISATTKSAASATGRTAVSAANAVVGSSYFSRGALWLSGALNKASRAAANVGNRGASK